MLDKSSELFYNNSIRHIYVFNFIENIQNKERMRFCGLVSETASALKNYGKGKKGRADNEYGR